MAIPLLEYLRRMVTMDGSDLLLASGFPPAVRVYGSMEPLPVPPLEHEDVLELLQSILMPQEYERIRDDKEIDFAYEGDLAECGINRFRCNAFVQRNGLSVVFRRIPWQPPDIDELNLPDGLTNLTAHHNGLVLITGPTGAGKSNTLAALCRHINEHRAVHMIMIEDPIEFVHYDCQAVVVQRQVGTHVISFARALKAALREDPDVIVIGELRDLETIQLALTAAETGHLVMGTMHTISATHTVSRIVGSFPAMQQWQVRAMLADSLKGVIAQQLVPRKDGDGCVPAVELMLHTDAIANLIREDKYHQIPSMIEASQQKGMYLMDHSLLRLVKEDLITPEEALNHAHNKVEFQNRLEDIGRKVGE